LAKGAYSYYCKIHPWMLGNLVVSWLQADAIKIKIIISLNGN
jgi:hypothetical protein